MAGVNLSSAREISRRTCGSLIELVGLVAEQLIEEARRQVMPGIIGFADLGRPRLDQAGVAEREIRLDAVLLHIELLQRTLDPMTRPLNISELGPKWEVKVPWSHVGFDADFGHVTQCEIAFSY